MPPCHLLVFLSEAQQVVGIPTVSLALNHGNLHKESHSQDREEILEIPVLLPPRLYGELCEWSFFMTYRQLL